MAVRARVDDLVSGRARELLDPHTTLVARELGEVRAVLEQAEAAAAAGATVAGFVAYDAAPAFDPALVVRGDEGGSALPLAWFTLFGRTEEVEPVAAPGRPVGAHWRSEWSRIEHERAVALIKEAIRAGRSYQVNLTTRRVAEAVTEPFLLYRQLASAQAGPFNVYLESDDWALACASPELFFERRAGVVTSRPMKGTAARGATPAEDACRARALLASAKERAENLMIVDLIRNDLGRVAAYGSVEVPELFALEAYPTVWQMTSTVRARIARGTLVDLFGALFPCGSVTGAPKVATMRLIAELEGSARGAYCGAIGIIEPTGAEPDARFAVGIRTAVVDRRRRRATYGVGGGITWDSVPAAEWAEIDAKAALLSHSGGVGLIETMRYEEPAGFVNVALHLERLAGSAAHFAIPFDPAAARRRLEALRGELAGPARVRLVLGASGELEVSAAPLEPDASEPLALVLDDVAQDETDELLGHKTTDRRRYEAATRRHPDADDVVLWNRRGEVTETTRANLAVRVDGRWWTPARSSGLLPGVERGRLLAEGVLAERVLTLEDLRSAEAVATVSSLRGWRSGVLRDEGPRSPLVSLGADGA